jgi:hypothetical protein
MNARTACPHRRHPNQSPIAFPFVVLDLGLPPDEHRALIVLLEQPIPAKWPPRHLPALLAVLDTCRNFQVSPDALNAPRARSVIRVKLSAPSALKAR